jgi:hypothetical protein
MVASNFLRKGWPRNGSKGEERMNENTFAFPHEITHLQKPLTAGMTLRDYFAAKAMQTILASQYEDGIYVGDLDNDSEDVCANSAYIMADAMLKAR